MADPARRHPDSVDGPWFVDTTCIDCDVSAQCAPWMFAHRRGQAVVVRQPANADEERDAARALLACPTGSIGTTGVRPPLGGLFPQPLGATVAGSEIHYCGYASPKSFGASAYFVRRPDGNLLIDAPRWVGALVESLAAAGGVRHLLLTHRDDVGDADRWAERFGAQTWIHAADADAAPWARCFDGADASAIAPGVLAVPLPGHTRGSAGFIVDDEALFSGDSVYWSRAARRLSAFPDATWYSWREQAASLERLAAHRFAWVLPGHGDRHRGDAAELRAQLVALVARMRASSPGAGGSDDGDW
jgi:glyoxylase-like metal-dependent hydrolase (beta-lactamase superfamily II)/ferredoxin